jgi:hypothetical protein
MTYAIEHPEGPLQWRDGCLCDAGGIEVALTDPNLDALLLRLLEVPHECGDPKCPGKQNKFQLDNYAEMLGRLRDAETQFHALVEILAEQPEELAACREERDRLQKALEILRKRKACQCDQTMDGEDCDLCVIEDALEWTQ